MLNRVAIITGATRGIGRKIAIDLSKAGYNIIVAGKTIKGSKKLPGDIYSVSNEIIKSGGNAIPFYLDVRDEKQIRKCVETTSKTWGRIDLLVNNAGALWWRDILETPAKRYDLINNVNTRASFLLARECIPTMLNNGGGHIINCSPPFFFRNRLAFKPSELKGKTAYMISKLGMTLSAMGLAEEYRGKGIASNTLWPITPIESYALINHKLGEKRHWRKPDIISDCILKIVKEDRNLFTGNQLIDEEYLRLKGVSDFSKYRCDKDYEPPQLKDIHHLWKAGFSKV